MYRLSSGCSTTSFPRCGSSDPSARVCASARALGLVIAMLLVLACLSPVSGAPAADRSRLAAADSAVAYTAALQGEMTRTRSEKDETSAQLTGQMQQLRGGVTQHLQQVLARLSTTSDETDPVRLVQLVDQKVSGLSFDPGRADIKDQHVPLLEKVQSILRLYPEASYIVEGHTDAAGDGAANQQLSERRAFALMQYLRQGLSIPADRIKAIGYGADKPIALNTTPAGRAKNRRIDIVILQ